MPELPEVETTRRGLAPLLLDQRVLKAIVRNSALRLPVPADLPRRLAGATIKTVDRRGKYLLIGCDRGTLIIHLGMSGRLWVIRQGAPVQAHDHFDLVLQNGTVVRFRDPRRFGLVVWCKTDPLRHALLASMGPEPFSDAFDGAWLHAATRTRSTVIKLVLMDSHVVAGVGNIYANEALFRAGIHPGLRASRMSRARCAALVSSIRETLDAALRAGGSSLRDYVGSHGEAGYFQNEFLVYARSGEGCLRCGATVREMRQGQRSTFYCPACQKR
jgi:formamidopyrimidine-DNA glycosylase